MKEKEINEQIEKDVLGLIERGMKSQGLTMDDLSIEKELTAVEKLEIARNEAINLYKENGKPDYEAGIVEGLKIAIEVLSDN